MAEQRDTGARPSPTGGPATPPQVLPWLVIYTVGRLGIAALLSLVLWMVGLGLLLGPAVRPAAVDAGRPTSLLRPSRERLTEALAARSVARAGRQGGPPHPAERHRVARSSAAEREPGAEQHPGRQGEQAGALQGADQRRSPAAGEHRPRRRHGQRHGEQRRAAPTAGRRRRRRRRRTRRRTARRSASRVARSPSRTARVRLPTAASPSMSRRLLTTRIATISRPIGTDDGEGQPRQRAGLHERRADDGDQAEEDEDEDLAQRPVAVGERAAGVGPGGGDAHRADGDQPPARQRGQRRARPPRRRRRRARPRPAPAAATRRPSRPAASARPGRRRCRGVPSE